MLYNYAAIIGELKEENRNLMIERMAADIRSMGRLRKSIKDEQLENILLAKDALLKKIGPVNSNDADRLLKTFQSFYL